ncbi:MAG: pantoate--beta-alanine ligase [Algoriphagus sp.]|nr:pantoate--beta-alanine ligase [Algoriphagus sp.]
MQVFHTGAEWQTNWLKSLQNGKTIGFVPTMGALHEGHLDLVKKSKKECDFTVVSIFVNPTQFNNPEDFAKYPTSLEPDLKKLEEEGTDFVFLPDTSTIYPEKPVLTLNFGELEYVLEGGFRPGHFNGVGIVVSKLFHIIKPDKAFFGQKDLQQVAVIKRLVRDLSFNLDLVIVPTRREIDGLAMSSRNLRLNPDERSQALILYSSLTKAKGELLAGKSWLDVHNQIIQDFNETPLAKLEYFELVHPEHFTQFETFDPLQKSSICVAAFLGSVRLIDNLPIIP